MTSYNPNCGHINCAGLTSCIQPRTFVTAPATEPSGCPDRRVTHAPDCPAVLDNRPGPCNCHASRASDECGDCAVLEGSARVAHINRDHPAPATEPPGERRWYAPSAASPRGRTVTAPATEPSGERDRHTAEWNTAWWEGYRVGHDAGTKGMPSLHPRATLDTGEPARRAEP